MYSREFNYIYFMLKTFQQCLKKLRGGGVHLVLGAAKGDNWYLASKNDRPWMRNFGPKTFKKAAINFILVVHFSLL